MIINDGIEQGPFTAEEIVGNGIKEDSQVKIVGTNAWIAAKDIEEIMNVLETTPPPIDVNLQADGNEPNLTQKVENTATGRPHKEIDNTKMFKNCLFFRGRARCLELWIVDLSIGLSCSLIAIILGASEKGNISVWEDLFGAYVILCLWLHFSELVRRCHDVGFSGFNLLIPLFSFWIRFVEGIESSNKYGNNPKGKPSVEK